jgi:hypothetical protein
MLAHASHSRVKKASKKLIIASNETTSIAKNSWHTTRQRRIKD